jgi:mersacidin/lichenicidin family type 2 lantibiotic
MSYLEIIQAWKDEEFRLNLSEAQQALLPKNPAGLIELTDAELEVAVGGARGIGYTSFPDAPNTSGCCWLN